MGWLSMQEESPLHNLLCQKRSMILSAWLNQMIQAYPPDAVPFLKNEKDQFANPVGYTLAQESEALFQDLLKGREALESSSSLEAIIRIKAVQDFSAGTAVSFVFVLKDVIRETLSEELSSVSILEELLEFESLIDRLGMMAFDEYSKCRERIYEIKANQMTHRTFKLLERAKLVCESEEQEDGEEFGCSYSMNGNGGIGK